jgi:hypothetical protein
MKTQAWAWLTAGVVALGLNGFYHDGGAAWAHRIAERVSDRSDSVVQRVSDHADRFVAEVRMAAGREEAAYCPFSTARAQFQGKMARTQHRFVPDQTRFAQTKIVRFEGMTNQEAVQAERLEANEEGTEARAEAQAEARADAQVIRMRIAPVAIDRAAFERVVIDPIRIRVACPRVRVNVPAVRIPVVNIPRMPAIGIPAPVISISGAESDSDPI